MVSPAAIAEPEALSHWRHIPRKSDRCTAPQSKQAYTLVAQAQSIGEFRLAAARISAFFPGSGAPPALKTQRVSCFNPDPFVRKNPGLLVVPPNEQQA